MVLNTLTLSRPMVEVRKFGTSEFLHGGAGGGGGSGGTGGGGWSGGGGAGVVWLSARNILVDNPTIPYIQAIGDAGSPGNAGSAGGTGGGGGGGGGGGFIQVVYGNTTSPVASFVSSNLIGWYTGNSWTGTQWNDTSGFGNHATVTRGNPGNASVTLNGLPVMSGSTADGIRFPSNILPASYTLFHVSRYNGATTKRIFDGVDVNAYSGFYNSGSGRAYHANQGSITNPNLGNAWILSSHTNTTYKSQMTMRPFATPFTGNTSFQLSVNHGLNVANETSEWAVAEVMVYNRMLSDAEVRGVEMYLQGKYNVLSLQTCDASGGRGGNGYSQNATSGDGGYGGDGGRIHLFNLSTGQSKLLVGDTGNAGTVATGGVGLAGVGGSGGNCKTHLI